MRIRPIHIIGGVLALVVLVFAYSVFAPSGKGAGAPIADDDAFLERIRAKADGAATDIEVGTMPGSTSDPTEVPRIELDFAQLDVGMVPNDQLHNTTVAVHNRGKADLVIDGIDTECACTQGNMVERIVKPGETGEMIVQINPFLIPGFESAKTLSIKTNDPIRRLVQLPVICTVDPEFEYEPRVTDFGTIQANAPQETEIILRQLGEEAIELKSVEPIGDLASLLEVDWQPVPEDQWQRAGKPEYRVQVRLKPTHRQGPIMIPYVLKTTCKRVPEYRAVVQAMVTGDINAIPSDLNEGPAGQNAEASAAGDES